jgi:hypothetical protein
MSWFDLFRADASESEAAAWLEAAQSHPPASSRQLSRRPEAR